MGSFALDRLTPEQEDKFIAGVERGVPWEALANAIGVDQSTLWRWRQPADTLSPALYSTETIARIRALQARIARAEAQAEVNMANALANAVGVVGKSGVPEYRAAIEWLQRRRPERWSQKVQVEAQHDTRRISIQLTPDEARDLVGRTVTDPPALHEPSEAGNG